VSVPFSATVKTIEAVSPLQRRPSQVFWPIASAPVNAVRI